MPASILLRDVFAHEGNLGEILKEFAYLPLFLLMIFIFGFPIAMPIFIIGFISFRNPRHLPLSILLGLGLFAITWALANMLTLQYPSGWISGLVDMPWWLAGH